jgi:hypothetical protein
MGENFATIVVCDTEYEVETGELPKSVSGCVRAEREASAPPALWRGICTNPPFDIGPDTLFVAIPHGPK